MNKNPYDTSLRMQIWTSSGREYLGIGEITDAPEYEKKAYWFYGNDAEFTELIELFTEILFKYGIAKLEEMSVPSPYFEPTNDMQEKLYLQHEQLSALFVEEYLNGRQISVEQAFDLLISMIDDSKGQVYDEKVGDLLLKAIAFLSDRMIEEYGGKWYWDTEAGYANIICYLSSERKVFTTPYGINPRIIFYKWQIHDSSDLKEAYYDMIRE